jgi:hypothetical protein
MPSGKSTIGIAVGLWAGCIIALKSIQTRRQVIYATMENTRQENHIG